MNPIRSHVYAYLLAVNLVGVLVVAALLLSAGRGETASAAAAAESVPTLIIDAGHGGADGGAVAPDGTQEKDLNLAISLPLADMLRVMGYQVSLTRTTDEMVGGVGSTMRERKVNDIKNRLAQAEQATVTVSIHQNKFTQSQYYGTQIFYSGNHEDSRLLASAVRESVLSLLQPENTRELKKGDSSIYLLYKVTRPAVLVECGFLSNEAELQKLKDTEYQRKMAFAVMGGVLQYGP